MIFHDPLMFENAYSFPIDIEILYKIMTMHLKINSSPTALVNSSFVIVSHILTTLFLVSSHLFTYVKGIFLSREDLIFNRGYNFFMQKMFVWRLNREKLYEERNSWMFSTVSNVFHMNFNAQNKQITLALFNTS